MHKIRKMGIILLKDKKFLINRKKNTQLFLLPGGKPKESESPEECMKREIKEEHSCDIENTNFIGTYSDQAANEKETIIEIDLYSATLVGEPRPSSEIVEQRWFGKEDDTEILSPIIKNKILPDLILKNIIT